MKMIILSAGHWDLKTAEESRKGGNMSQVNQGKGSQETRFPRMQEERVEDFLKNVKFRKQIFGGVSEKDVWTKIGELNELYRQGILAERARYDALLEERGLTKAAEQNGSGKAGD